MNIDTKIKLVSPQTLTASYGVASGVVEVSRNVNDVTLYLGFLAGTNGDTLKASVLFSPDGNLYFPECNDEVSTITTTTRPKEYFLLDTAGASPTNIFADYVGDLLSVDASETQTDVANKQRLTLNLIPITTTTPTIRHNGTAFGTVTERANDAAFTSPAAGTVEWSLATGNLNFAAADLVSYRGQKITATYTTKYNLFRIVVPTLDNYLKVGLRDLAAGSHGTGFCYYSFGPNFK